MKLIRLFILLVLAQSSLAQKMDLDLMGGISNYQGDLQPIVFTFQNASPAIGVNLKYRITEKFFIRSGIMLGRIQGDDKKNRPDLRMRNLNFKSHLYDFHAGLEYRLLDGEVFPVTPYVFAGAAVFSFNPYTFYGPDNERVYLQPLGTEGQGLPEYPDRKPYALIQPALLYGGGIRWQVSCNLNIGIELRQTKTFTDYLDDVSTTYANPDALLRGNGPLALELAWRGDELNGAPYPDVFLNRGNPKGKDWYYFFGLTAGLRLKDCETGNWSLGGLLGSRGNSGRGGYKKRRGLGCPKVW